MNNLWISLCIACLIIVVLNFTYLALGAVGALIKDILTDGGLALPRVNQGKISLGFLGSALIGGVTACIADNDPLTALTAGFTSFAIIESLILQKREIIPQRNESIEELIRRIANQNGIDAELAIKVARCESSLNPKAINVNDGGSIDRGLYQINNKYHPEVTEAQAFDPEFATQFFCTAFKNGNLSWWKATQKCWEK